MAYTLEEPPLFRTPLMGSAVHARGVAAESNDIRGVIVLEMVGYFSDQRWSQGFPLPVLRLFYPGRGHFIAVVGRWDQGEWVKTVGMLPREEMVLLDEALKQDCEHEYEQGSG